MGKWIFICIATDSLLSVVEDVRLKLWENMELSSRACAPEECENYYAYPSEILSV